MPRGIPLTEEDRDQVRRHIFQAASKLFVRNGFHETSMRQIAEKARIGKSTIYGYFSSKEEILLFFVEQEMAGSHAMAARIADKSMSASDKLRVILHSLWIDLERNKDMVSLLTREVARLGEAGTSRLVKKRLQFRAVLKEIIEQGIAEGEFRHSDSGMLATALHSLITMPFYDWLHRNESKGGGNIADWMIDLFFNSMDNQSNDLNRCLCEWR
jgi:AcrR family transcriptional regulator